MVVVKRCARDGAAKQLRKVCLCQTITQSFFCVSISKNRHKTDYDKESTWKWPHANCARCVYMCGGGISGTDKSFHSLSRSRFRFLSQERVDAKLCFGIPDEGEGPTGDFDECSIKDMKIILRKIGVPEEELVKCVEKSDFIKLMELVSQVTTCSCINKYVYVCVYGICVIVPILSHLSLSLPLISHLSLFLSLPLCLYPHPDVDDNRRRGE